MAKSQNGYPANDVNNTENRQIPGTGRSVRLAKGEPGFLLRHFAAWFHEHIEPIDTGIYDDWGYAARPIRGSTITLSNHASGTALDLNATRHPLGVRGTFTAAQAARIRAQLRRYDGAIRWGGDYTVRADEMHFEINTSRAHVRAVAQRIRREDRAATTPSPEEDDMPYTDWPKKDRDALVADVAAAVLAAKVTNKAADGHVQGEVSVSSILTNLERSQDQRFAQLRDEIRALKGDPGDPAAGA